MSDGIQEIARQQVARLCETWGYGFVMHTAQQAWAEKDPNGCLTIGPTPAAASRDAQDLEEYRRLLRAIATAHKPSDTSGQITGDKDCASVVGGPHT